MARYLGEEGFGDYTTITTFAIFFSTMSDMGFYLIAIREMSKPKSDESAIFSNAFTMRLVAAAFFVLVAPLAALAFDYDTDVKLGILIAALGTFFIAINQILVAIFQMRLRTDQVAIAEVVGRVVFLGAIMVLAYLEMGVLSFVWAFGAGSLVNFFVLYLSSRKFLRFRIRFNGDRWKKILAAAWPIGLVIIVNLLYFRFNVILLSIMKPAEDVGIFGAAYKIIEILIAFPAIFVGLVIPILSRYLTENKDKFRDVFHRSFNALILIATPIAIGTQFVADWIIKLVGGDAFQDSVVVLQILIVAVLAMFLSSLAINTVIVINRQRSMIWVSSIAAVTSIVLNLLLIPRFTYIGTAYTTVITEFVIVLLTYIIIYRHAKLAPQALAVARVLLSGAVMGAVLFLLGSDNAFLNLIIGALVYGTMVMVTRAFRFQDMKELLTTSRKEPS